MAYTIISQNNTTTTLCDENGNVITVPARVTLATSTDYTIKKVNNNSVDLESGDGKIIRGVPACVVLAGGGGGGGGSVDYAKTVQRAETMPTADASNAGQQFLYSGESDATYTHGYIYENVATTTSSSASAEQTVGSTLSDIAVDIDTLESFTGWTTDNSLQIFYTADGWSVDATSLGVTYTGTPNVGDAITITYTAESTSYAWTRVDVQPAGASYTAGNGISIDANNEISVADPVLTNVATFDTGTNLGVFGGNAFGRGGYGVAIGQLSRAGTQSTAIGTLATCNDAYSIAIGRGTYTDVQRATAIGMGVRATATNAIIIGAGGNEFATATNSDANTFKVANANGNFEIMSADGTIPEARLADTTNAQQGDVLTLDSTGNAVWQAGGGGGNYLPLTGGTLTGIITQDIGTSGWADFVAVKNTSYPNNPTVLQVQSSTTSSLNFRVKSGGNISLTSVYGISASEVAGSIGSPTAPFNSISVEMIFARGSNYNYPITVPQNTTGTMVVATPPTADGTYVLKATVSSGVVTYAWVAE